MSFGRHRVARLLSLTWLAAAACGGAPPPATRPTAPQAPVSPTDPSAGLIAATPSAAPKPVPAASISGRITGGGSTPAPLPRARVILMQDPPSVAPSVPPSAPPSEPTPEPTPEPRVTISGPDGSYKFERLPAGNYTVYATGSKFAPRLYAERRNSAPPPITLADNQQVTGIDIELPPAGVIVGQVLDEDQRPFVGATVDALSSRMENGRATFVSVATTTSDDRGEFRLAGLPDGQFYVSAFDPAFVNVGDETGPLRYTATYYPGVAFVEQATRVSVTAGVEPTGKIVFALKIVRPAQVSGRIVSEDKRQLTAGAVIMSPIHSEGLATVPSNDVSINPDGTFVFRNVAPGRYQIRARAETDPEGVALFGAYVTEVSGRDLRSVELTLVPGATVEGALSFEASETPKPLTFAGLRVRAPFADGSSLGDVLTGDVTVAGTYRIRGVMSGTHQFAVEGLQAPWVIKQILWRGRNITDTPIDVEAREALDDVRIVLTDVANDISGVVLDARGRPAPEALVVVIPVVPAFRVRTSRRFALRYADGQGRYRVRGLPAGDYRAVASLELDESEVYRKELLEEFFDRGAPLMLAEHQARTLDLRLTSLSKSKLKRTSTR